MPAKGYKLADYLNAIKNINTADSEHKYRPDLKELLEALKDGFEQSHKDSKMQISHEPSKAEVGSEQKGLGRPDFIISHHSLTLGYIENKRVGANLQELIDTANKDENAQISRYLKLSDNLILTDYLNFWRVRKDERGKIYTQESEKLQICTLNELAKFTNQKAIQDKETKLFELFKHFFLSEVETISNAKNFTNKLALRTRELRDAIKELEKHETIQALYNRFVQILYKELKFEKFASSFAQMLTYSLFIARLNNDSGDKIDLYNAQKFIPKSFPLIHSMSSFLRELDNLDKALNDSQKSNLNTIIWLVKEILSVINNTDTNIITNELSQISEKESKIHKDPYIYFYEPFLAQYDSKEREEMGVYYTHYSIVDFIIRAIDSALKSDFECENGLSNALDESSPITLLDFATGTGTFLLEAFRNALKEVSKGPKRHIQIQRLISRFSGFEFLIAPYTIANLKISQFLKEDYDYDLSKNANQSLQIFLTNTLYNKKDSEEAIKKGEVGLFSSDLNELANEFTKSQNVKNSQILVITGNPPYSGTSQNKGFFEDEVKITYGLEPSLSQLTPKEQSQIDDYFRAIYNGEKASKKDYDSIFNSKKLQNENNTKVILNDYVKFIRFAQQLIEKKDKGIIDKGIIALITANSFLYSPTFRGMRYNLLKTFDKIYILDLHGSNTKKEKTPDGSKDDNVFDIQQGVCISVFVKTNSCHSERSEESTAHNKHSNSQNTLTCHSEHSEESTAHNKHLNLKMDSNLAKLYHYDLYGEREFKYNFLLENDLNSIRWGELNPQKPFYLFVPQALAKDDPSRELYNGFLSIRDIFAHSNSGIKTSNDKVLIATNAKKLELGVREFYNEFDEKFVKNIAYRPFDTQKIYYDLNKVERPRIDIMQHFLGCENVGLLVSRQSQFTDAQEFNNAMISNKIVDLNYFRVCGVVVMPLYLKTENSHNSQRGANSQRDTKSPHPCESGAKSPPPLRRGVWGVGEKTHENTKNSQNSVNLKANSAQNSQISQNDNFADAKSTHPQTPSAREGALNSANSTPQGALSRAHALPLANAAMQGEGALMVENFTPKFREFIDAKYSEKFSPEQILGYIYAILYHKIYREKFLDFLKIDFPRIPFCESVEKFLKLSELGQELIKLHLMTKASINKLEKELKNIGASEWKNDELNVIDEKLYKNAYKEDTQQIFVNKSLHFDNVSAGVWAYKIGGYQVLKTYLKYHKGEEIDFEHFENIIKVLHKTLQIEDEIGRIELV